MRLSLVIVLLTATAVCLVHVRREQARARHEEQGQRIRQLELRRTLWDQEVRIGQLTAPDKVRWRVRQMPLQLVDKHRVPEPFVTVQTEPDPAVPEWNP